MQTIKLTKENVIEFIKAYYQKYEGREINVDTNTDEQLVGPGPFEYKEAVTTVTIYEEVEVLGVKTNVEETLSNEELKEMFSTLLEEKGYVVKKMEFDDGVTSHYEGSQRDVTLVKAGYFNGISLTVEKVKQKTLGTKN